MIWIGLLGHVSRLNMQYSNFCVRVNKWNKNWLTLTGGHGISMIFLWEYYGISKSIWQKKHDHRGLHHSSRPGVFFGWHGLNLRCDRWRFPKIGVPLNHPFYWFSIITQPFWGNYPHDFGHPQMSIEERPAICPVTTIYPACSAVVRIISPPHYRWLVITCGTTSIINMNSHRKTTFWCNNQGPGINFM